MGEPESQSRDLPLALASPNLQLEVVGGVHSGVRLSLEDGDYSIGSKSEADIVLRDEGVAAQHVIICVDGREVRAEAVGGDLRIGDQDIEAGHGYRLRLPAELIIGNASIKLSRDGDKGGLFDRFPIAEKIAARPVAAALSAVGCVLAVIAASYALQGPGNDETRSEFAMTNDSGAVPTSVREAAAPADAGTATHELESKLETAGLSNIIVAADGTRITASGSVAQSQASAWTTIQRWFDRTYAPALMLSANVHVSSASAQPAIHLQAIWYGDHPYIIADNGTRYYEGAVLEGGWILQSIDNERVLLKKDEETLTLSYK